MLRIGKLVATHGLNGQLILTHQAGKSNWLQKGMILFVAVQKGSHIPFFVHQVKAVNDQEYHVLFEDTSTIDMAKKLVGKAVYVETKILEQAKINSPILWIGFEVLDTQLGVLGTLSDIAQTGHQWVGSLNYKGKEVLIPLVAPLLIETNWALKQLKVSLPDGLLDL